MDNKNNKPIITPKQERTSLRAKKNKKPLKFTLITPYNVIYLPIVINEHSEQITEILLRLPRLLPEKKTIPWSKIREIPKQDRKSFRQKQQADKTFPTNENIRKALILGLNSVTQHLESKSIDAVLLSHDIQPVHLFQHLLDLSVLNKIPVLIIQNLRETLFQSVGIASMCIGIKKIDDSTVDSLCNLINSISIIYEIPDEHAFKSNKITISDDNDIPIAKIEKLDENLESECKNLLLKRIDMKSRVFVPNTKNESNQFKDDFIRLTTNVSKNCKKHIDIQVAKMLAKDKNIKQKIKQIRRQERVGFKFQSNKFKKDHMKRKV